MSTTQHNVNPSKTQEHGHRETNQPFIHNCFAHHLEFFGLDALLCASTAAVLTLRTYTIPKVGTQQKFTLTFSIGIILDA